MTLEADGEARVGRWSYNRDLKTQQNARVMRIDAQDFPARPA